jgi:hypothetical protein
MNIDWRQLQKQKLFLVGLQGVVADPEGHLEGLINFLDALQDEAVENGLTTEEETFGLEN